MKKSSKIIGIGIFILLTATISFAQKHYLCYQGSAFKGRTSNDDWHHTDGFAYKPFSPGVLDCSINFPDFKKNQRIRKIYINKNHVTPCYIKTYDRTDMLCFIRYELT